MYISCVSNEADIFTWYITISHSNDKDTELSYSLSCSFFPVPVL